MNSEYFERLSNFAKKAQEPLQSLAELNVKTLQGMTYLKPDEFTQIKNPEQLLEKQIELAVTNGHKALNYMQKSFEIMEKAMMSMVQEAKSAKNKSMKGM
ncbi:Phasin protein (plasmid) [Legionella adelaidensis]|uniref:Phasin protein n=1 Tax=Legionella adelaidensis TaxID=45056 RepID=A0A0W0R5T2_9GAMM|nr:phasin family protein [Legionella adelaidensis]KTC66438.1 Phasin protein [Legionella adelaidensis]VEH86274.1 Phasin protein [Legionella adelaidensis]